MAYVGLSNCHSLNRKESGTRTNISCAEARTGDLCSIDEVAANLQEVIRQGEPNDHGWDL